MDIEQQPPRIFNAPCRADFTMVNDDVRPSDCITHHYVGWPNMRPLTAADWWVMGTAIGGAIDEPGDEDPREDLISALHIASDDGLTPVEIQQIVAAFIATLPLPEWPEDARNPGVNPALASLGAVHHGDGRYRGTGFCSE